jgi:membrane protein required for colicin V production
MEDFNYLDIVVISLVVILGFRGFITGFVKELFSLIGIIGGVFVASRFSKDIGIFINDNIFEIANNSALGAVGFAIGFVLFIVFASVIGMAVSKIVDGIGLGILDKIIGSVVSAGKIFLIFSIIAYGANSVKAIQQNIEDKVENSMVYPILVDTGSYIVKLDTDKLVDDINDTIDDAKDDVQDKIKSSVENAKENMQNIGN